MATNVADDGGPIYPCNSPIHQGMTLRDWMAGQALAGFTRARDAEMFNEHTTRWYARVAYALADAMLLERKERRERAEVPLERAPFRGDIPDVAPGAQTWAVAGGAH